MDREDLDRQMAEKETVSPQHTGSPHGKKILALAAVVLIVGGGIGGYYFHELPFLKHQTEAGYKLPESAAGKDFDLPAVRNTAIVQAVREVGPSIVGITTKAYDRDIFNRRIEVGTSVGSGVLFDAKGYIVTNAHVVSDAKTVNVSLSNGETVEGTVVGRDAATDLAVVKIEGNEGLPVATFGNSDELQVGETAIAIGNPLGLEFQGSVTVGVISALNRTIDEMDPPHSDGRGYQSGQFRRGACDGGRESRRHQQREDCEDGRRGDGICHSGEPGAAHHRGAYCEWKGHARVSRFLRRGQGHGGALRLHVAEGCAGRDGASRRQKQSDGDFRDSSGRFHHGACRERGDHDARASRNFGGASAGRNGGSALLA